jgi:hypothetical protein
LSLKTPFYGRADFATDSDNRVDSGSLSAVCRDYSFSEKYDAICEVNKQCGACEIAGGCIANFTKRWNDYAASPWQQVVAQSQEMPASNAEARETNG